MLGISPQTSIFIAVSHVDFRLGIDGLAQRCRSVLAQDPMSGCLFVFKNRRSNAIKILSYDGQGFVLYHKRWSSGKLTWWPLSHIHVLRGTGTSLCNGNNQVQTV